MASTIALSEPEVNMVIKLEAAARLVAELDVHYKKISKVLIALGFTGLGTTMPIRADTPTLRTPFTHWDRSKTESILGKPFRKDKDLHYVAADKDTLLGIIVDEPNKVVTLKTDINILENF